MNSPKPWSLESSIVSDQLKRFVPEKVAEARAARPAGTGRSREFDTLLAAAENGDWPAMKDIFEKWHTAAMKWEPFWALRPSEWLVALELEGALEQFADGVEEYAVQCSRDLIASIPAGSILFCSHGARGVLAALRESSKHVEALFTLTHEAMADKGCLQYWRNLYVERIYVPTEADGARCYNEYREDARRRLEENKLRGGRLLRMAEVQRGESIALDCANFIRPGEFVTEEEVEGKVQFSNALSAMAINGLVTRLMFDKNPDREFYIEQCSPIEWMFPHLSPHGLIMRINRQPLAQLSDEMIQKDRDYWARYLEPMIGDWLQYDTPVGKIARFAEKLHVKRDFSGFKGDPRLVQNRPTQRLFSKLRCGIGDLYAWRARNAKDPAERNRMTREADFAYRQVFALCPGSPEAVYRYVNLLMGEKRIGDAILVTEMATTIEPEKAAAELLDYLKRSMN